MLSTPHFAILGPLDVRTDGQPATLNAGKLRVLLAALLVHANELVSIDELTERLWDGNPSASARRTVHVYALRLRRLLGDDARCPSLIHTRPNGYIIEVDPDNLDLLRFRQLHEQAKKAARDGEPAVESALLQEALTLWRGRALTDVPSDSMQRDVVPRLDEERLLVQERRTQIGLDLGQHRELIGSLVELTKSHPWHERFWVQLICALYRSDRVADALGTCREVERKYRVELGIDPSEELRELHRTILDGTMQPTASPLADRETLLPAARVSQLPPAVHSLVGRDKFVVGLSDVLTSDGSDRGRPILALSGLPGVGKTAVALQVAHHLRAAFPDGQLYADLQGYSRVPPLPAATVLARFLSALGVPPTRMPRALEDRTALYRSLLADRQVFVLLDNAAQPEQIRPLLPGGPGCAVLVTSRNDLRGLSVTHTVTRRSIPVLPTEDACSVLTEIIGAPRATAEPQALAVLAKECSCLPLALRIAGVNLAASPHATVAEYVQYLRERGRLSQLVIDGDETTAIRTAFDHSYQWLKPEDSLLFRHLSDAPAGVFTVQTVRALQSGTWVDAERSLDRLAAMNLIEQRGTGKYQLHDLVREYAADRAQAAGREGGRPVAAAGSRPAGTSSAPHRIPDRQAAG